MIEPGTVGILMFPTVVLCLMLGFPVAFTLSGVAFIFAGAGEFFGLFDTALLGGLPSRVYGIMVNQVFVAVPLFVFMGVVLERSQIAENLLMTLGRLMGRMRGGLGISAVIVGALLAASTGVVGATVVTMGLISLPAMLRVGYDPRLATGIICASGTLGQIIPPSIVLILLADILQGAYAQAQMEIGNFAPDPVSVIDLFAGALIPGILLVSLYCLWVVRQAIFAPESCPAVPPDESQTGDGLFTQVMKALVPPLALIIAVLGSILTGIATPTESAAIGSLGAMLLAALNGKLELDTLRSAMRSTLQITSMIFLILVGASIFSLVFRGFEGDLLVEVFLKGMPGGIYSAMLFVMVVIFLLGFVLDFVEIMFLVVPIVGPIILQSDISPVWFGIMIAINLQTSFLTPPFGFSLFYLRAVAPASVDTISIYRGIIPFVCLQVLGLAIIWTFPALTTWLPDVLF